MERSMLAPGVYLNTIDAQKFNRCRISLHFRFPARRDRATAHALLPLVLDRGYADCPDMTELSRRLAGLYGADLSVDLTSNGADRVLSVSVCGIRDAFALDGEDLTAQYASIALGVAFRPYLVNGCFDPEAVEIEKDKLKKRLQAEINDKRLYCVRQARRKFYGDAPEGIERDGYLEEVPGVTPAELYEAYQEVLRTATLDVMVLGADPAAVCAQLEQALAGIRREPAALAGPSAQPRGLPRHFAEKLPGMTQAKLCMLFTSAAPLAAEEIDVCRLAMSLFGGSTTSRLFLNVREKQSLCYYCGSSLQSMVGCMTVDSGVEPAKAEQAQAAILAELDRLCAGPIEDEELEDCRRGLLSGLESVGDSLSGLENWYYMEICRGGEVRTPAQSAARLRAVTRDQVRALLARFSFSVAYLVTSPEGGADHA